MKKTFVFLCLSFCLFCCTNNVKEKNDVVENRVVLRTDTLNVVKLTDTLVIYESACRGCAYESSTSFAISDSMNIVRLADIVTTDNKTADMAGGSISKDLVLVANKTGITQVKLYKFWKQEKNAEDSARFTTYTIEVKQ